MKALAPNAETQQPDATQSTSGLRLDARLAREKAETELATLQEQIAPLEKEINQLGRQFWVTKDQVKANKYDLSASRYRQVEHDEEYFEEPSVTLERLGELDMASEREIKALTDGLTR